LLLFIDDHVFVNCFIILRYKSNVKQKTKHIRRTTHHCRTFAYCFVTGVFITVVT